MLSKILPRALLAFAFSASASATFLYAASYSGDITTLNLTVTPPAAAAGRRRCGQSAQPTAELVALGSTDGCAGSPAWLELDYDNALLYCSDEGLTKATGSMSSFRTSDDGVLELLNKIDTRQGPVSSVLYGNGGLAVAHYAGSMLNLLDVSNPESLTPFQNETFTLDGPGPNPGRQDAPHPHQAVLDPTGAFIVVPDLGADLVRVFAVQEDGLSVEVLDPLAAAPGSGPRHLSFFQGEDITVMYLISELSNTITGYAVDYSDGGLAFEEIFVIPTHGEGEEVPEGAAAAEILVSPDGRFLTISSRNENAFTIPSPVPAEEGEEDAGEIPSDTLVTFSIDQSTGELELVQKAPSGGVGPRQFVFSKAGDLVAVGLQRDSRVVVLSRNVETGEVGGAVAGVSIEGGVTCVIFDE